MGCAAGGESGLGQCTDAEDNDGDGLVDCLDPDCVPQDHCHINGCSPSNCVGCCGSDGTCFLGNELSACGIAGAACEVCGVGYACSGECRRIREDCSNNIDDDGNGATDCADAQCSSLPACASCTVAEAGGTITDTCAGGDICECGTDDFCTDGDCVGVGSLQYELDIVTATLPSTKPDGSCWDIALCGAPDIWVDVRYADAAPIVASLTRADSFTGVWDSASSSALSLALGTEIVATVYDDDAPATSEAGFECRFTIDAATLRSRTLVCSGALGSLWLDLFPL